jgi:hypothetical protein
MLQLVLTWFVEHWTQMIVAVFGSAGTMYTFFWARYATRRPGTNGTASQSIRGAAARAAEAVKLSADDFIGNPIEAGANPMWQLMAGFCDLSIVPDLT